MIRSAKKLGVETVAVYSDTDYKNSMHVQLATEAKYLVFFSFYVKLMISGSFFDILFIQGGNLSKDSYLRMDRLIQIAKETGAQVLFKLNHVYCSFYSYLRFNRRSIPAMASCLKILNLQIWSRLPDYDLSAHQAVLC